MTWSTYLPSRETSSRFFKYALLLIALTLTLKVVFDGFSYYIARRSLDTELESKKISSLEYLGVVTKRERAFVIDTIETRCLERNVLAMFRVLDADVSKKLHDAYLKSFELKDSLVDLTNRVERDHKDLAEVIDLPDLRKEINKATFALATVDRILKPPATITRNDPRFVAAAQELVKLLREDGRPYAEQLAVFAKARADARAAVGKESEQFKVIEVLERRLSRLKEERQRNKQKSGDLDDVLSRYAVWTDALTGGAAGDNPVLDEAAFLLSDDNRQKLGEINCERFATYLAKVNGRSPGVDPGDSGNPADDAKSRGFLRWLADVPTAISDYYKALLFDFFNKPPVAQTLFVTLALGALGALTINVLRLSKVGWWSAQPDPLWGEVVLSPLLGALAAFGIFLLGSSGLLLTSDAKSGGATSLSAFFIGMLGFVSGLLYDEAFGRVRRFGSQFFATDSPVIVIGPEDRSLAETLRNAKASFVADIVLKFGIGKRLSAEPEFTLLVPSDEAMSRLTLQQWREISEPTTRTKFEGWLRRHHALKRVVKADVAAGAVTELQAEDGKYTLAIAGSDLKINQVRVVQPDVSWGNGVIHILEEDV